MDKKCNRQKPRRRTLLAQIRWRPLVVVSSRGKRRAFMSFLAGNLLTTAVRKFDGVWLPSTYTWKGRLLEQPHEAGWAASVLFHA